VRQHSFSSESEVSGSVHRTKSRVREVPKITPSCTASAIFIWQQGSLNLGKKPTGLTPEHTKFLMKTLVVPVLPPLNTAGMQNPSHFILGSNSCSQHDSFHAQMSTLLPSKRSLMSWLVSLSHKLFVNPVMTEPDTLPSSRGLPTTSSPCFCRTPTSQTCTKQRGHWTPFCPSTAWFSLFPPLLYCKSPAAETQDTRTACASWLPTIAKNGQILNIWMPPLYSKQLSAEQIHPAPKPKTSQQLTACKGPAQNQICF